MGEEIKRWVVLELTSKAENEDPDLIRASIRHHIRNAEVFVPASIVQRGDQRVCHYLVDGYAFIKDQHPEVYYSRLKDTKYVQNPLYVSTGHKKDKRLATITSEEVEELRRQIKVEVDQGIAVDDIVTITSGPYKHISAVVREEILEQDSVVVHIQLRSTDRLVTLPRAFLQLKSKSPYVVCKTALESMGKWTKAALLLAGWSYNISEIYQSYRNLRQLDNWIQECKKHYFFIRAYHTQFDFIPLQNKFRDFQRLHSGIFLRNQILTVCAPLPNWSRITTKYREVSFLTGSCTKIRTLYLGVKKMTEPVPMNLIVDGTQLYIRCLCAPGLGDLKDSKGRPTGAIVGCLRSLGAYRKRFPDARIYMCWDGSSQRRKSVYSDYKANRVSHTSEEKIPFEFNWLRDNLPLFGIRQAFNPKEEADDVIASLVRGPLREHINIIISTDRDLLQLVTESTHQLCPSVGLSKEKLYTTSLIESEYGVAPEAMVHVKALSGDTSDNIPGVSGFGLKTASKLIRMYGTVTALLASNLAGMGKVQIAKLMASKQQVEKNIDLLSLQDVYFNEIESNPNQREAEVKLKELEIKGTSILASFFPQ
jgi:5'-3' exonuclease/transcription antitermination factor NusG